MSKPPMPPFLPNDLESFQQHAVEHLPEWFEYCRQAYSALDDQAATIKKQELQILELAANLQLEKQETERSQSQLIELRAIQGY